MVAIVAPERLAEVEAICERWELHHAAIGEVTDSGELRALWDGEVVGSIPARLLTDECPRYAVDREARVAPPEQPIAAAPPVAQALRELIGSDALRVARVRLSALRPARPVAHGPPPGSRRRRAAASPLDRGLAAVARRAGPDRAALDPFTGGALAILESARNVACTGGEPLGFTDCLNFGNPEKAEVGWQLTEVIEGMARACEALGLPIVSGNVSLYNDTDGRSIHPTPVVGCVGLVADVRRVPRGWQEGDVILLAPPARCRSPAPSTRRATAPSGACRRRSTSPPRQRSSTGSGVSRRARHSPTTSPRAGWPSLSRRLRSSPEWGPCSTWATTSTSCSARGPARRSSPYRRDQAEVDTRRLAGRCAQHRRRRRRRDPRRPGRRAPGRMGE